MNHNGTIASNEPFIFDNNWGNWGNLPLDSRQLTTTNADGEPVIPLTEEQKFTFDSKGWLVIPGLIPEDDLKEMQDYCHRLKYDIESLLPHMRTPHRRAIGKTRRSPCRCRLL